MLAIIIGYEIYTTRDRSEGKKQIKEGKENKWDESTGPREDRRGRRRKRKPERQTDESRRHSLYEKLKDRILGPRTVFRARERI